MLFEHGGDAFGMDILYDFSANINPLGMSEIVKKSLVNSVEDFEKYPDPYCRKLTRKIAQKTNVEPEKIVCGNGAADLIFRIIFSVKPKKCVICAPTFSEYEKALIETGCEISYHFLSEENDFCIDEKIFKTLENGCDMLILCDPNNPVGGTIPVDILREICGECLRKNVVFLCDECFLDFVEGGEKLSALNFLNAKTVVLKAFTKICAMAGLRLGYAAFGDPTLAENVRRSGQCWSVSVPAQIAGIAALDENGYLERTRDYVKKERDFLLKKLSEFGQNVFDAPANYITIKSDIPLYDALLKEKILIRKCDNFRGLDERFFRIAVRTHEENVAFVEAVGRIING